MKDYHEGKLGELVNLLFEKEIQFSRK